MPELDKEKILNGTLEKRFVNGRLDLEKDYTKSNAYSFFYVYNEAPISFILQHSRDIFSETYYGFAFYMDIIKNKPINPLRYPDELAKAKTVLDKARKSKLPTEQIEMFSSLVNTLELLTKNFECINRCFRRASINLGIYQYLDTLFDYIVTEDYADGEAINPFGSIEDPFFTIPCGLIVTNFDRTFQDNLSYVIRYYKNHINDLREDAVKKAVRTKLCIDILSDDKFAMSLLQSMPSYIINEWMYVLDETSDLLKPMKLPVIPAPEKITMTDFMSAVESVVEAAEDEDYQERLFGAKYDALAKKHHLYKAYESFYQESMELEEEVPKGTFEQVEDIVNELESSMMYLEWSKDGTPNKVLAKHIARRGDIETDEKEKEENIKKAIESKAPESDEDEVPEEVEEPKDDGEEKPREESSFFEETSSSKDVDGEDKSKNTSKPEKPKEDLATRIEIKALDYDAKETRKDAERAERLQKLKNAGNAVSQRPKKRIEKADSLVQKFDEWDDNRRKDFILKPGNRHKLFKKLKLALMYGSVASMKLSYLPIAFMFRKLSKNKDKRIRNELQLEIDSEIRICEEKISDASAAGDTKAKYELMRIRDKLKAERQRVMLNSKYV